MKKPHFFIATITITLFTIASISGCKKKEDTPAATTTNTTTPDANTLNLCDKTFKMTAWTSAPAWLGVTDVYAVTQACYKDNTMVFHTNGTLTGDEGATKCNAGDSQTSTGTWVFASSQTVLVVNDTTIYDILINDGTTLKLLAPYVSNGSTLMFTTTFTKQ